MTAALGALLKEIRACTLCAKDLPLGPRPVVRAEARARLLIIGQAPGTKVHESGVPWNDPSGDRLREWMGISRDAFYDPSRIAIMPMGFCYPGRLEKGGDRPPRPECAPAWHARLSDQLPDIALILLVGSYAQKFYLGVENARTVAETVQGWARLGPRYFPLPHPSWRTKAWAKRYPWFEAEVIPELRRRLATVWSD